MEENIFICKNPGCKKEFRDFHSVKRIYCSTSCKNKHLKVRYSGESHPLFGTHRKEEVRKKIGEKNKGKHHSTETKLKISNTLKGKERKLRDIRKCSNNWCNKIFECLPSSKRRFCSKECKYMYISVLSKGHPAYFILKKDMSKREENVCKNPLCNKKFVSLKSAKRKYCCNNCRLQVFKSQENVDKRINNRKLNSTKGFTHSKETKLKMSLSHKGRIGWNKGKPAWNRGIPQTEEQKQKISKTVLNNVYSLTREERKEKYGKHNIGRKLSDIQKEKRALSAQKNIVERGRKGSHVSKSEIAWGKEIEKIFNVNLEHSFWIGGRCFDYKYKNYLFELDGSYWHRGERAKIDKLKENISKKFNYVLIRFALDSVKEVRGCVRDNYTLLKGIFDE